jgi:hypothetical protein
MGDDDVNFTCSAQGNPKKELSLKYRSHTHTVLILFGENRIIECSAIARIQEKHTLLSVGFSAQSVLYIKTSATRSAFN